MSTTDRFLHHRYDAILQTPMQEKLRRLAPMPVGAVFLPWPGMTEEDARSHFRQMKELGFTCLKQTMALLPEWPSERIFNLALDEGIIPFWYAEGGWEDITPELLTKLGLDPAMDIDEAMEHPAMIAHQTEVIRAQIGAKDAGKSAMAKPDKPQHADTSNMTREELRARAHVVPGVVGNVKGHEVHPDAIPHFIAWLKDQYGDIETLKKAWNVEHVGLQGKMLAWTSWEDVERGFETDIASKDYRNLRDKMRFRAETFVKNFIASKIELQKLENPNVPMRAGGEMGIFLPFASRGTDMELMGRTMAEGGSFYPSIHLTWHFEEVHYEVMRSVYMQASMTRDWAKGVWCATWESTGGPSWFSGGKAPFVPWAQDKVPGFTCNAATMTQLMLSYIAAGYLGYGLWTWNHRTAGWEGGEYAILDRNRNVTDRARRVGAIGKASKKYRRELWQAHKEPMVGIMQDWENEAIWASMSVTGRDIYKSEPIRARVGASRAFINGNIPWEYVTPTNLVDGLGPRYEIIYLPAFICLTDKLIALLTDYVKQGGRLVMDMPGAYFDDFGRIISTAVGSGFEQLFGVVLHEFGYSRTEPQNNVYSIGGVTLEGFTAEMTPTTARTVTTYAEQGGAAITENQLGEGTAVIIGAEASKFCAVPGNETMEAFIRRYTLDGRQSPYACDNAVVYRIASPAADHYFLLNDGAEVTASLDTGSYSYADCTDAITGESLIIGAPVTIEREGGRWLRFGKPAG